MGNPIKVAVMGCGHIGSYVSRAVLLAPDMKLVGIIEAGCKVEEIQQKFPGIQVVSSWKELPEKPDVLILGLPSRMVIQLAPELLAAGINTVDCFDMHGEPFMNLRRHLGAGCQVQPMCVDYGRRGGSGCQHHHAGLVRNVGANRFNLCHLRSRHEHGSYSSCKIIQRCERCPFHHPPGRSLATTSETFTW